jgi:hypothetical protein
MQPNILIYQFHFIAENFWKPSFHTDQGPGAPGPGTVRWIYPCYLTELLESTREKKLTTSLA